MAVVKAGMTARRQWLLILLIAGLGAMAVTFVREYAKPDCEALAGEALVSKRAAELCTSQLVGCGMSYEQVRQVIAEQHSAESCK